MRTIIYDINSKELNKKFKSDTKLISAKECKKSCVGCFNCWVKHPLKCALNDEYSSIVPFIANSSELILISKCRYGCYSHEVKRVLERCISYVLPYFTIREDEIHHATRYKKDLKLTLYLYGDITEDDKKCIEKMLKANAINLNATSYEYFTYKNEKELIKCLH